MVFINARLGCFSMSGLLHVLHGQWYHELFQKRGSFIMKVFVVMVRDANILDWPGVYFPFLVIFLLELISETTQQIERQIQYENNFEKQESCDLNVIRVEYRPAFT